MIPTTSFDMSELESVEYSDKEYRLNTGKDTIVGTCDKIEAVKQAVFKMLNTERYDNLIYSWDYGVELKDLYGMPMSYVQPEIKRRFEEALLQDERISEVYDFEFEVRGHELHVSFFVTCDYGKFSAERTVTI